MVLFTVMEHALTDKRCYIYIYLSLSLIALLVWHWWQYSLKRKSQRHLFLRCCLQGEVIQYNLLEMLQSAMPVRLLKHSREGYKQLCPFLVLMSAAKCLPEQLLTRRSACDKHPQYHHDCNFWEV